MSSSGTSPDSIPPSRHWSAVDVDDLRERKRVWRTALKAHRRAREIQGLEGAEREAITDQLVELLHDQVKPGYVIATYVPFGAEPDVSGFTRYLLDREAVVLIPDLSVSPDGRTIPFRQIGEPRKPAGQWEPPGDIQTIIVPSLALDGQGVRLGRGAGWYDRALRRFFIPESGYPVAPTLVGVCYEQEFQEDGDLPAESHDQYLDVAVTELRTVQIGRGQPL